MSKLRSSSEKQNFENTVVCDSSQKLVSELCYFSFVDLSVSDGVAAVVSDVGFDDAGFDDAGFDDDNDLGCVAEVAVLDSFFLIFPEEAAAAALLSLGLSLAALVRIFLPASSSLLARPLFPAATTFDTPRKKKYDPTPAATT